MYNMSICAETDEKTIAGNEKDEFHIKAKDLIKDGKFLVEIFNQHYINIVQYIDGFMSTCMGKALWPDLEKKALNEILHKYKNYPSI